MATFDERLARARARERWVQVYREQPEVFRAFEDAEDPDGIAAERLRSLAGTDGRRVLELGCGTGWLTRRLAPGAAAYLALDASASMLGMHERGGEAGGRRQLLRGRAERLPLAGVSVDRVVASWLLLDLRPDLRRAAADEARRVLAPGGELWVIENVGTGEFQQLRDLVDDRDDGLGEARPLVDELGLELRAVVPSELRFGDTGTARQVLGAILGEAVGTELERAPRARVGLDLGLFVLPLAP